MNELDEMDWMAKENEKMAYSKELIDMATNMYPNPAQREAYLQGFKDAYEMIAASYFEEDGVYELGKLVNGGAD